MLFIATVLLAFSIPLVNGKVPPNQIYGFRTAKTLANAKTWFEANAFAGKASIVCALIMFALTITYLVMARRWHTQDSQLLWLGFVFEVIPPTILVIVLLMYDARLPSGNR
jgi:uncharacterized membrane protein